MLVLTFKEFLLNVLTSSEVHKFKFILKLRLKKIKWVLTL